ncbi:hypothetical protein [Psychrobacter sp. FDAARGOS_221]|uniref:hypothetical protein n=1 Tax=Psychrobacter sp. FDAARGOS_221 TaxID=1975705 RepID=UPI000BB55A2D|nr:hypothetical protein [Psychrobacter sp. FDAARGOS_221]PNK61528.1 hypothetical protein A6J60_012075 [Psychrobacter sp. FDAARGOS_221]
MSSDKILIHNWLNDEIKSKVTQDNIEPLVIELHYLLDLLPPSYNEFDNEKKALKDWLDNYSLDSTVRESSVYKNGINNESFLKDIIEKPLIAFLASRADTNKVNQIRSVYLFVCLKMVVLTKYKSRIKTTLDECRLLTTKYRDFLVQFLPDVRNFTSLRKLLSALEEIKNSNLYEIWLNENKESLESFISKIKARPHIDEKDKDWTDPDLCNYRLSKYLYDFILPIEKVVEQKQGITRKFSSVGKPKVISTDIYVDELTGDATATIYSINLPPNENQTSETFEIDERQDDDNEAVFEVKLDKPTSYHLDIVNAQQQINMRRKRSMLLNTDVQVAKDYEVKILFDELFTDLKTYDISYLDDSNHMIALNTKEQIATYILVIMLTGSTKIIRNYDVKEQYDRYCIDLEFSPTRAKLDEQYSSELSTVENDSLELTLPRLIGILIESFKVSIKKSENKDKVFFNNIEKSAKNRIKEINKRNNIRLSLSKLKNHIKHVLLHSGTDTAVIDVITSSPVNHLSALPYFSITKGDIYYAQFHYFSYLKYNLLMANDNTSNRETAKNKM